jgi:hypothetical protein
MNSFWICGVPDRYHFLWSTESTYNNTVVKLINTGNVVKLFVFKFLNLYLYDLYIHNRLYILVLLDTSLVTQSSKNATKYSYKKEATDKMDLLIKKFNSCAVS